MTSSEEVKIINPIGLHGRHLQDFLKVTNYFGPAVSIWLEKDSKRVNAKSMLGVMSLGIIGGVSFKVVVNISGGNTEEEKKVLADIIELINCLNKIDGELDNILSKYNNSV